MEKGGIIPKLSFPRQGPYCVVQAYENGTVTIQKAPFVTDRVNIRRIRSYYTLTTMTSIPKWWLVLTHILDSL